MKMHLKSDTRSARTLVAALAIMLVFTAAFVFGTARVHARSAEYVSRVDVTLESPECGLEVAKNDMSYHDAKYQDYPPRVSVSGSKYSVLECSEEAPASFWPYWVDEISEEQVPSLIKLTDDAEVYARFTVAAKEGYTFFDGEQVSDNVEYKGEVFVNGKKANEVILYPSVSPDETDILIIFAKPDLAHAWDAGKVTAEPTETKAGSKEFTCSRCGATKTEAIPATGGKTASKSKIPVYASMTSSGKNGIRFSWAKVEGADGYDIFLSKCNSNGKPYTPKKIHTVNDGKSGKWTKKGLNVGVAYKGSVKAFREVNGKKEYIGESFTIHAFTNNGNKFFTNPKSVKVRSKKAKLRAGSTFKIKASVRKMRPGKKLISRKHTAKLRYISSDPSVAKVSKNGKVTARAAGRCKIYVIAANGVRSSVGITVK